MTMKNCSCLTQENIVSKKKEILCKEWIEYCMVTYPDLMYHGFAGYAAVRNRIIYPLLCNIKLTEATSAVFASIKAAIVKEKSETVTRDSMKSLFNMMEKAVEFKLILNNPISPEMLIVKETHVKNNIILSELQLEQLKLLILNADNAAALSVACVSGIPFSYLKGIRWEDIDFINSTIQIRRRIAGSGQSFICETLPVRKQRIIVLPEYTISLLCKEHDKWLYQKRHDDSKKMKQYVFVNGAGSFYTHRFLYHDLEIIAKSLKIEKLNYSDLIYNSARFAIQCGVHIKDILDNYGAEGKSDYLANVYRELRLEDACND